MPEKYNPQAIEPKWQAKWEADKLYRSTIDPNRPKHYALTMLPYPSGDLHIGHWYAMSPSDARARYMRMKGFNVLFPMGFDAFGLPAENAAIKRNIHPAKWTFANIDRMRKQFYSMGAIFDWEREVISADPSYYKWTQWFFLKFYENGLAYRALASVDFCPNCNTTLAREQVWGEDRHCERCGTPVIKKDLEQWFFKITNYAEELLDHSAIAWPEKVKVMQTNWIGKSEGARVHFRTEQGGHTITVFTTRPDTLWGATFMVLAPEHPLVDALTSPDQRRAVEAYMAAAARQSEIERTATDKEKTGVFTGGYAINPVNGARIPVWIADYVLMNYGTGAIMAVPAHDERDFAFARKFGLPIQVVIQPEGADPLDGATMTAAYDGEGVMVNSAHFNGTPTTNRNAIRAVIDWLESQQIGERAVNYRLRDWLISRQRYWGAPIPMIYCDSCGVVPVPEDQLPVLLPEDVEFMPTGESPLKKHLGFLNTTCPKCGGPARRETDTMDTFMCSSWYQLRYLSPKYDKAPFDPEEGAYWLPVDQYTGGIEHATMHLMYTRFFTKAMRDCGIYADAERIRAERGWPAYASISHEPMLALYNQGMILGEPMDGSYVLCLGKWDDETLKADKVIVIDEAAAKILSAAEDMANGLIRSVDSMATAFGMTLSAVFDDAGKMNTVVGEIIKRNDNVLVVERANETQATIEIAEDAQIVDRAGNVVPVAGLRYRLGVEKMSKSKGNVVAPDELVAQYGADVVRGYLMFAFRWESGGPWDSQGIQGVVRWLNDVWNIVTDTPANAGEVTAAEVRAVRRRVHQTIKRVGDGLETFSFNTAVAALMELKNYLAGLRKSPITSHPVWGEAIRTMLLLMAPVTPFITEELWEVLGQPYSIHNQAWPTYDADAAKEDEITLVVSVNGKVRARITAPAGIDQAAATALALGTEEIQKFVNGGEPKKVIYVAERGMLNIVV